METNQEYPDVSQTLLHVHKSPRLSSDDRCEWPNHLVPGTYVISLTKKRPERLDAFNRRLKGWTEHVSVFDATDGVPDEFTGMYTCHTGLTGLTRGQLGCYHSHLRVWRDAVDKGYPSVLVMEDDVDLTPTPRCTEILRKTIHDANQTDPNWQLLMLGNPSQVPTQRFGKYLARHNLPCIGLFAYMIKRELMLKLLSLSHPQSQPIDVFILDYVRKNEVSWYYAYPRLCYVVPVVSDTQN